MRRSGKRAVDSSLMVLVAIALLLVSVAPLSTNLSNTETSRKVPARFSQVGGSSPTADMETAVEIAWIRQFGSVEPVFVDGIAVDASGGYVAGWSRGVLPGQTGAGGFVRKYDVAGNEVWTRVFGDSARGIAVHTSGVSVTGTASGELPGQRTAFVLRYDVDGNEIWTRQFGTLHGSSGEAVDVVDSGVYMAGWTDDALPGQTSAGEDDAFVRKYDVDGNEIWTRQFGTPSQDWVAGIVADVSGIYAAGWTSGALPGQTNAGGQDGFVRKYDVDGNEIWTRQFGSSTWDVVLSIDIDTSGVLVAGWTLGALPGQTSAGTADAFVRKYDIDGNVVWTRQFGTSEFDGAFGITVDASGVYVAGSTSGVLPGQTNAGGQDGFVRKYDVDGNEIWTRQFGTSGLDEASGIAVDASRVYVVGSALGALPGQTTAGGFVRKYDVAGNEVWTRQFGASGLDDASGIAGDASGIYVSGWTSGVLPGQTSSTVVIGYYVDLNAFVRKYDLDGNEVWTRQFGSLCRGAPAGAGGLSPNTPPRIAADGSAVYFAGTMYCFSGVGTDPFVRKYDAEGNEVWTRMFDTPSDEYTGGIAVDASGVYLAGWVESTGAFVRKYDLDGNEVWTRQFGAPSALGTAPTGIRALSVGASGVYVAGWTDGAFQTSAGGRDAFVRKYNTDGNVVWTYQFGTSGDDQAEAIVVDPSGVYVTGTGGTAFRKLDSDGRELWTIPASGQALAADATGIYLAGGTSDVYVRKYDADGNEVWTQQFGSPGDDSPEGITADGSGVYVAGWTDGALPGQTSAGERDAFVAKLGVVSGPIPPSAPQGLSALPGDAQVALTWQAPSSDGGSPVTNYKVYRGTASGGEVLLTTLGNVFAYTDTGVANGQVYYYQISAVNGVGEGARSIEVYATPVPSDTTNPTVTITSPAAGVILISRTVSISGTASDNVAVQKVEFSTDGTTWTLASGTTSWSGTLTVVEGQNTIYVRVTDTSGNTATTTVTVTVQTPTQGPTPQGLDPVVLGLVAVAVVGVGAVAAVLVLRKRKKD